MKHAFVRRLACGTVLAGLAAALMPVAAGASDNKIALIPGGPHPYFAPWEQAAADAKPGAVSNATITVTAMYEQKHPITHEAKVTFTLAK